MIESFTLDVSKKDTIWWKDLIAVGMIGEKNYNCFSNTISWKLCNKSFIRLWKHKWLGSNSLSQQF